MKKQLLFLFFCIYSVQLFAKDGYHIQLQLKNRKDSEIYLAFYYGKSFPTIFKVDSAKIDDQGKAVFNKTDKIVGGIYLVLTDDHKSYFEFLLDNGDDFSIDADMNHVPESLVFKNSENNNDFLKYENFLSEFSTKQKKLIAQLAKQKTKADTNKLYKEINEQGKELEYYRNVYCNNHPTTLLSSIFQALEVPDPGTEQHLLPDGTIDSGYVFRYYKKHFWDHFNFHDDRLIHTPILESKLDQYFNKIIYQEDSAIVEADKLLAKMKHSENLFKFTLNWLSTNAQTSKIMGMDKLFVHLVDKYYMKGDATWLTTEELQKYIDRAQKIAPTVINSPAPDIKAYDIDNNIHDLYDFKAKYTLLIFFATDCSHCQHEMPILDSLYYTILKEKGVRVIAFNVERDKDKWKDFIKENHMEEWLNVWDPEMKSRYWALYDVQSTPTIFLMDENKIIVGKDLNHTNILRVVNINDAKQKLKK